MLQVRPHSLVLDPYVGTGSILVAAAARGAYTMGTDIDIRVIKRGKVDPTTGKQLDIYRWGNRLY
jgi:tRNA (guanine10-N2)-methyltransferase